jgi:hypothetical protein
MTTVDGRSPGSRVSTFRRLHETRDPNGRLAEDSPLTVAGGCRGIERLIARTAFPFIPEGNRRVKLRGLLSPCQFVERPPVHDRP